MNETQVLKETEIAGRAFRIYGTAERPLFVAKDIASWIDHSDASMMIRGIDDDEKDTSIVCTPGGNQEMVMLTENGLYEVLFQSRKPIAKEFKKQVKSVLKSIRETGGYISGQETASDEDLIARALVVANNIIERKNRIIADMTPKAAFHDAVTQSPDTLDFAQVAKILNIPGMGRNNMLLELRERGVLRYDNSPYQVYVDRGYFKQVEMPFTRGNIVGVGLKTVVFQKGVDFIRKELAK